MSVFGFALAGPMTLPAQQTAPSMPPPAAAEAATRPTRETYRRLAVEVEANLKNQILAKWYPRAMDKQGGGFFQNYNEDWSPGITGSKAIVYESRLTWTAAQAAMRFPEQAAMYSAAARHGLDFLAKKMWDQTNGGFFWSVDDNGNPAAGRGGNDGGTKQEYGNGFAIYASAAVYKLTRDPAALELAKKGFLWYDEHGHDAVNGGYFEILSADGKPDTNATSAVGGGRNGKTMNSSIHMLEALTGLYEVWPDARVKARLQEMFGILRDKVVADPGYLVQFLSADWKPRASDDSYGHDVETSYLLVEAAATLGMPDDARTWAAARKLVDHALAAGWDKSLGGLYNSGNIEGGNYAAAREWWVQAEMLNALLLMHEHFGKDNPQYWKAFVAQWDWINQHGLDPVNGGWWPLVKNDGSPVHGAKSNNWTECYHQGRALLNVSARLRHLAETTGSK
ncbi:MAG TPA: AGE family epimerase/isomerase [Candidatus Limnocylindrales bacterium]|nr:AGE family epimerase/isomerase [Candidatus Limnocylindrales bacterium]